MKQIPVIIFFLFNCGVKIYAQYTQKYIESGNEFYKKQQYDKAAEEYSKALAISPDDSIAQYNLGLTWYRLGKKNEATAAFDRMIDIQNNSNRDPKLYYNKGVILSSEHKLQESIEAYKEALRINPDDKDARENLEKALLELKKEAAQKKNDKKQQPSTPKINPKDLKKDMDQLEQKEKNVLKRQQNNESKNGSATKDW